MQDLVVRIKMDELTVARIDLAIHEVKFKMRWFYGSFPGIRRLLRRREYIAACLLLEDEQRRVGALEIRERESTL